MSTRESVHRLIDDLPEEAVEALERFFVHLVSLDPPERTLLLRQKTSLALDARLPPRAGAD